MSTDALDGIATRIEKSIEAALENSSFYYLSRLGLDLGNDLQTLKLLTKRSLGDFIRERYSEKYSIVVVGGPYKTTQAVIRNASQGAEQPSIFNVENQGTSDAKRSPRYHYRFWAAFSVPYQSGRRFLNLRDCTFENVPDGSQPPDGYVEIPQELIAPTEIADRDKLILENIQKWLDRNQFDKSDFYAVRAQKHVIAPATGLTVLEAMIAALDTRQLASTSLTLDVVSALMRKRA
jgi:hypothetical protein